MGSFGISEGNTTGEKKKTNKQTEYKPNCNCGKENFPAKGSNLITWPTHRTKDCRNTKGELAAVYWPLPAQRQRGRLVTARGRRQGAATISAPETASSYDSEQAPSCLLRSWVVAWFAGRVAA